MNYFKIITELTSFCNFNCKYCYQDEIRKNLKLKFIDKEKYKNIISKLFSSKMIKSRCLLLTWRGEALLHPDFRELLAFVFQKDSESSDPSFVGINTNCFALDDKLSSKIVLDLQKKDESCVFEMVFSLDAFERNSFKLLKGCDERERVYENVKIFTKKLLKNDIRNTVLRYQYLINRESYSEAEQFYDFWKKWFENFGIIPSLYFDYQDKIDIPDSDDRFRIFFHRTDISDSTEKNYADDLHNQLRTKYDNSNDDSFSILEDEIQNRQSFCQEPFETVSVGIDGKVSLCCKDIYEELIIGNVFQDEIDDILMSEKAVEIRKNFQQGKACEKYELCRNCGK